MKKYIIELPESTMSLARNDGFMSRSGDLITAQFNINNLTPVEDNNSVDVGDIVIVKPYEDAKRRVAVITSNTEHDLISVEWMYADGNTGGAIDINDLDEFTKTGYKSESIFKVFEEIERAQQRLNER